MNFELLTRMNVERCARWHKGGVTEWRPEQWFLATVGEMGETANALKKLWRIENDMPNISSSERQLSTREDAIAVIGEEIADTVIYLNLFATVIKCKLKETIALPSTKLKADHYLRKATEMLHKAAWCFFEELGEPSETNVYLDSTVYNMQMVAKLLGLDFDEIIIKKFNATSVKYGFPERL